MSTRELPEDFYDRIKPRLQQRVGREIRVARRVLDLGCGSCELVKYLAETYDQEITGVDISSKSLPTRRRTPRGVRFRCLSRDARNLGFIADQAVDAVVVFWALHEMEHPEAVLAEAHRVLRPGGKILVVDFPKESLADRLWHEAYYRPDQIRSLLSDEGFDEAKVRLIERKQILWASGHKPARKAHVASLAEKIA